MTIFNTFPVARKQHECTSRVDDTCSIKIEAGTRYCRSAATPDYEYGSGHWWTQRLCPSCAAYFRTPVPEAVA